jgi:integrase
VQNSRVPLAASQAWRTVKQFPKADGRRQIFLDRPQRRALLEAATGNVRDLIEAALLTGARPGELVNATRGQFDARTKTLKLAGKVGQREIPLTGAALALLERVSKSKLPAALLFTRDDGQPWTRIEWSRQIRAAAEAAVIKDEKGEPAKDDKGKEVKLPTGVSLYVARHCYITQALMDGLTTMDVAHLTGTSLAMIQAHYGQYVQSAVRERIEKVQML